MSKRAENECDTDLASVVFDLEGDEGFGSEVVGGLGAAPAAVHPAAVIAAGGDFILQQRD